MRLSHNHRSPAYPTFAGCSQLPLLDQCFRLVLRLDPSSLLTLFRSGDVLVQQGELAEAIATNQKSLRCNPGESTSVYGWVWVKRWRSKGLSQRRSQHRDSQSIFTVNSGTVIKL